MQSLIFTTMLATVLFTNSALALPWARIFKSKTAKEVTKKAVERVIMGIDLGTTNSAVAVNGKILRNTLGNRTTPSKVFFGEDGRIVVGEMASSYDGAIFSAKRVIGKDIFDVERMDGFPFELVEGENSLAAFKIGEKTFLPEQVSAEVLKEMKRIGEQDIGKKVKEAVVTVPAYFNTFQKEDTIKAGILAGFEKIHLLEEPTAAVMAHTKGRIDEASKKFLVFDFGGGTMDVSVVDVEKNIDTGTFEYVVRAIAGDSYLGGDNLDEAVAKKFLDEFAETNGINLQSLNGDELFELKQTFRELAERAKINLYSGEDIPKKGIELNRDLILGKYTFAKTMGKEEYENMTVKILQDTINVAEDARKRAEETYENVDEVLLVGGSTRNLKLREMLQEKYPNVKINHDLNPDEVVAQGASIYGKALATSGDVLPDVKLSNIVPMPVGTVIENSSTKKLVADEIIEAGKSIKDNSVTKGYSSKGNSAMVEIIQGNGIIDEIDNPYSLKNSYLGGVSVDGVEIGATIQLTLRYAENGTLIARARVPAEHTLNGKEIDKTVEITREKFIRQKKEFVEKQNQLHASQNPDEAVENVNLNRKKGNVDNSNFKNVSLNRESSTLDTKGLDAINLDANKGIGKTTGENISMEDAMMHLLVQNFELLKKLEGIEVALANDAAKNIKKPRKKINPQPKKVEE